MALSMPSKLGTKVSKSTTAPTATSVGSSSPSLGATHSASSLLAGAAVVANRQANRRAALLGGPSAPVVKSNLRYSVVSTERIFFSVTSHFYTLSGRLLVPQHALPCQQVFQWTFSHWPWTLSDGTFCISDFSEKVDCSDRFMLFPCDDL